MRLLATLLITLHLVSLLPADTGEEVRAQQKSEAEKYWSETLAKGAKVSSHATEHFLLIGTADAKQLATLGKAAEKALPQIRKALRLEDSQRSWDGYLIVHVCKARTEFRALFFRLKRDKAMGDETGAFAHEGKTTQIVLAPAGGKRQLATELELVSQLGSALLTRTQEMGSIPVWFVLGFGRSMAYRHAPKQFLPERQQAALLANKGKNIYDVQGDQLDPWEHAILGASLADFLVHGGQMEKYWPEILKNLGGGRDFYATAREAKLDLDLLQKSWAAWVKNPR